MREKLPELIAANVPAAERMMKIGSMWKALLMKKRESNFTYP
jgi:hypothetical protein